MKRTDLHYGQLMWLLPLGLLIGCMDNPAIDDQGTGTEERPNMIPGGGEDFTQEESEEELTASFSAQNKDGVLINYHRTGKDECEVIKGNYSGVLDIPATAKYNNRDLKVTSIERLAFAQPATNYDNPYYSGITEVSIPATMQHIGEGAFFECQLDRVSYEDVISMISITYDDCNSTPLAATLRQTQHLYVGNEEVTELTVPEGVTRILPFAFGYCQNITRINLPSTLKEIRDDAFICCESLTEINLPDGLALIGQQAFYGCAFSSIRIPKGVTELKALTFSNNLNLQEVFVCSETPPICDPECFSISSSIEIPEYISGILYVPEGCIEAYSKAEVWNKFRHIKEFDSEGNIITNTDDSMLTGTWLQLWGGMMDCMRFSEDHKFSQWKVYEREWPYYTIHLYTDVPFTFDANLLIATVMPPDEEPFLLKFKYIGQESLMLDDDSFISYTRREE